MRFNVLIGSLLVVASLGAEASEPIVVLEYGQRGSSHEYGNDFSTHPFRIDLDYQQSHKVMPDETLGHIMALGKTDKVQQSQSYREEQNEIFFFGG